MKINFRDVNVDKNKALEVIYWQLNKMDDKVHIINNTITKYLLSLLYYKNIILINSISIDWTFKKNEIIISRFESN